MLYLARRLTRPGVLMLVYLYAYSITQFLLFFTRDNIIVTLFGLNLKQAQWTSLALFVVLLPITYWVLRTSKPVPADEVAATYGIPQKPKPAEQPEAKTSEDEVVEIQNTPEDQIEEVDDEPVTEDHTSKEEKKQSKQKNRDYVSFVAWAEGARAPIRPCNKTYIKITFEISA